MVVVVVVVAKKTETVLLKNSEFQKRKTPLTKQPMQKRPHQRSKMAGLECNGLLVVQIWEVSRGTYDGKVCLSPAAVLPPEVLLLSSLVFCRKRRKKENKQQQPSCHSNNTELGCCDYY
jgi:hypothetical protein